MSFETLLDREEGLVKEILSYCDFDTLMKARRTCTDIKRLSDQALDSWVDVIVEQKLPLKCWGGEDPVQDYMKTCKGWTTGCQSRLELIETALKSCLGALSLRLENYDEEEVRDNLRVYNVQLTPVEGGEPFDEGKYLE